VSRESSTGDGCPARSPRRAVPGDASALTRLRAVMLADMAVLPPVDDWSAAAEAAFARRLAADDRFCAVLLEVDGVAVSAGAAWIEEHLPSPGRPDGRHAMIASMATVPTHRRHGHARAVFVELVNWCRHQGVPRIDLWATDDAVSLYGSFGFQPRGGTAMTWTASR